MKDITILFFGKTGVGKSSTLNKLFNLDWATDNSIACTKEPQFCYVDRLYWKDLALPYDRVQVVDMPGIGESMDDDKIYMPYYKEWIPKIHSLVWVIQADTRAYKRDENFLTELLPLFPPSLFLTIALNKIDYLGIDEGEEGFDIVTGKPSSSQISRVADKVDDIYEIFKRVIGEQIIFEKDQFVPYTSTYGWGTKKLKEKIMLRR